MSPRKASSFLKKEIERRGLSFTKITGRTRDFSDLCRSSSIVVTIEGWQPSPVADEIRKFGKDNGFLVMFVTTQGVHG